ncbi:MAG: hypothetical protein ABMA64_04860 [Myxococcota bacterium]
MSTWLVLRFVKMAALALLGAGIGGAFLSRDLEERRRAVYWLATPGLILTWLAGFGLARESHVSLGSDWISASILLGLGLFQLVVWSVEREGRRTWWVVALAIVALLSAVGLMVSKPGTRTQVHTEAE